MVKLLKQFTVEQYGEMLSTSLGRSNKPPHQVDSPQSPQYNSNTSDNSDMAELLRKLSLDKYTDLFNQQEVSWCSSVDYCSIS